MIYMIYNIKAICITFNCTKAVQQTITGLPGLETEGVWEMEIQKN